MIRRPPRSTQSRSSAASDVYKRQGCGHGQYGEAFCLVSPYPMFPAAYLCPCLIAPDHLAFAHGRFKQLISGQGFLGKSLDDIVNASFTEPDPETVLQKLLHPLVGKVLPGMQVTDHGLQAAAVL